MPQRDPEAREVEEGAVSTYCGFLLLFSLSSMSWAQSSPRKQPSSTHPSATQSAATKDTGPSLQETTDWIRQKMLKYGEVNRTGIGASVSRRIDDVAFSDCKSTVEVQTDERFPQSQNYLKQTETTLVFDLWDVNSVETSSDSSAFGWNLRLQSKLKDNPFHAVAHVDTNIASYPTTTAWVNTIVFQIADSDVANRIAKAFEHVVALCKERKPANSEPF